MNGSCSIGAVCGDKGSVWNLAVPIPRAFPPTFQRRAASYGPVAVPGMQWKEIKYLTPGPFPIFYRGSQHPKS